MTSRQLKWATSLWLRSMGVVPPSMIEMVSMGLPASVQAPNLTYGKLFDMYAAVLDTGTHEDLRMDYETELCYPLNICTLRDGIVRIEFMPVLSSRACEPRPVLKGDDLRLSMENIVVDYQALTTFNFYDELVNFLRPFVVGHIPYSFSQYLIDKDLVKAVDSKHIHHFTVNPELDLEIRC